MTNIKNRVISDPSDLPPGSRRAWRELVSIVDEIRGATNRNTARAETLSAGQSGIFTALEAQSNIITEQAAVVGSLTETFQPILPPLVPSDPTLTTGLGVINIAWDGNLMEVPGQEYDDEGNPIGTPGTPEPVSYVDSAGFRYVYAEISPTGIEGDPNDDEFVTDWVQVGQPLNQSGVIVVQAEVGSTQYIRLQSENYGGVKSGYSNVVSIVVEGVTLPDVESDITDALQGALNAAEEAQVTADGKVTFSPNAPTNADGANKPVGAVWWQRNGAGIVTGMWEWNGTAPWVSRAFDDAVIGNLNAGKIDAGFIDTARLQASSIATSKLLVGSYDNLVDDPNFSQGLTAWTVNTPTNAWAVVDTVGAPGNAARLTASASWHTLLGPRISAQEGDQFFVTLRAQRSVASGTAGIRVYFRDKTGADISNGGPNFGAAAGVWETITGNVTAPAGTATAQYVLIASAAPAGAIYYYAKPGMLRRQTGELIVDGAITADKISANAVTTAKLAAGAVTANEIAAGAISASIVAGKVISTSATNSGQRVQLDSTGLRTFNASNAVTAALTAASGGMVLSGSLTAGTTARRVVVSDQGRVEFWSSPTNQTGQITSSSDSGQSSIDFRSNGDSRIEIIKTTPGTTPAEAINVWSEYITLGRAESELSRVSVLAYSLFYEDIILLDSNLNVDTNRIIGSHYPYAVAQGSVAITPSAANTPTGASVTFPASRFTVAPRLQVTPITGLPGTVVTGWGYSSVSASGATIVLTRTNTTATSLAWTATQMSSGSADG